MLAQHVELSQPHVLNVLAGYFKRMLCHKTEEWGVSISVLDNSRVNVTYVLIIPKNSNHIKNIS